MKISKKQLLNLIKEEMTQSEAPAVTPDATPDGTKTSDAKIIVSKLPTIDLPNEYMEILMAVMNHEVDRKDMVIKKVFGPTLGAAILKTLSSS